MIDEKLMEDWKSHADWLLDKVRTVTAMAQERFEGKEVTLLHNAGKYRGRAAVITHVYCERGVMMFLCMVTRAGTNPEDRDFLCASDPRSRMYRPIEDFVVLK